MITRKSGISYLYIGILYAFLNGDNLSVTHIAGFNAVPVFTCHNTGRTARASGLIKIKCILHDNYPL
jgi:hypothetical protein